MQRAGLAFGTDDHTAFTELADIEGPTDQSANAAAT